MLELLRRGPQALHDLRGDHLRRRQVRRRLACRILERDNGSAHSALNTVCTAERLHRVPISMPVAEGLSPRGVERDWPRPS